jgi:hypothetical protein
VYLHACAHDVFIPWSSFTHGLLLFGSRVVFSQALTMHRHDVNPQWGHATPLKQVVSPTEQAMQRKAAYIHKDRTQEEAHAEKLRAARDQFQKTYQYKMSLKTSLQLDAQAKERKEKAARDQEYAQRQRTHLVQDSSVLPYPTGDLADSPVSSPFGTRAQQLAGLLRFASTYPKHPIRPEEKDLNLDAAREHVRSSSALAARPPSSSPSSYSGPSRSSSLPADRGPAGLRARTRLWSRQEEEAGARRGEGFSAPVGRRATSGRGGGKQEDVNTPVRV